MHGDKFRIVRIMAIAAMVCVLPRAAHAQASGATPIECSSAQADFDRVEETVCLGGSAAGLYGSAEADSSDYAQIPMTGAESVLYDGSSEIQDTGFQNGSANTSRVIPRINDVYTLNGTMYECYDITDQSDSMDCYWNGLDMLSVWVQVQAGVDPGLAFAPVPLQGLPETPFAVHATSASPVSIRYSVVSGPASVNLTTGAVTLTGTVGTVVLQATQAADSPMYTAATATTSFQVVPMSNPTLVFGPIPEQGYPEAGFPVSASTNSTGAITYSVTGPAQIVSSTPSGATIMVTGFGTVVLQAAQAATPAYYAATKTTSFSVVNRIYSYSIDSYAPNSNILGYTDSVNGVWSNISYDNLNRLSAATETPVTGNAQSFCWSYDSFGNRTKQSVSNQPFGSGCTLAGGASLLGNNAASYDVPFGNLNNHTNRVLSTNASGTTIAPTYDSSGDITYDGSNGYVYDGEGRVCAVANAPISGGVVLTQYIYDAEGTRVGKGTNTNTSAGCDTSGSTFTLTNWYVLGPNGEQLTETDGQGNWKHTNVFAAGQLIATYDAQSSGTPALHFQFADWLGTRRVQTDYAGNMEESCQSLAFGDDQTCTLTNLATADDATEHHFTGQQRDVESGNDYFDARYYSSAMGRLISPDPGNVGVKIENPQSWNMYSYSLNNPLAFTDPTGMYVCEDSQDCSSANDQQFKDALSEARVAASNLSGADLLNATNAINSYGGEGVDNGVKVGFDSSISGGLTQVSGAADGNKSDLNPNGQNISVRFNPNFANDAYGGADIVSHEGSHVADASAWVASGFSASFDPTYHQGDIDANHVQFNIMNSINNAQTPAGSSWAGAGLYGGSVKWDQGDTFKKITPDLENAIRKAYAGRGIDDDSKPSFQKGSVLPK
jgi:RHS repeat-associated protein